MRSQAMLSEDVLMGIRQGMPVYGPFSAKIGTVKYIQFADDTIDGYAFVEDQRVRDAAEPMRMRLLKDGFICINTGLFVKDRFARSTQIASVTDDGIQLMVGKDSLTTL